MGSGRVGGRAVRCRVGQQGSRVPSTVQRERQDPLPSLQPVVQHSQREVRVPHGLAPVREPGHELARGHRVLRGTPWGTVTMSMDESARALDRAQEIGSPRVPGGVPGTGRGRAGARARGRRDAAA